MVKQVDIPFWAAESGYSQTLHVRSDLSSKPQKGKMIAKILLLKTLALLQKNYS